MAPRPKRVPLRGLAHLGVVIMMVTTKEVTTKVISYNYQSSYKEDNYLRVSRDRMAPGS